MSERIGWKKLEYATASALGLAAFLLYAVTSCRTVNFIDSGELASVNSTLGIAHPTGYPLFTEIGWIFAHLPLGLRVIQKLNLMAAFFCAGGIFLFFRLMLFLLSEFPGQKKPQVLTKRALYQYFLPAAFGTLVLAASETYWSTATSIEVYPLHVFLVPVVMLLFLRSVSSEGSGRESLAFAYALGLSFTNHMTTILLAPAFLWLFFRRHGRSGFRRIGRLVPPFLLGLSAYLYLPIRARQAPVLNWGNPADLQHFLWHVSGKVYRVWIFSSMEIARKQLAYFVNSLPDEFAYFPLILALVGFLSLIARSRQLWVFTLLLFAGCLAYSINYDINDIDSYFLLAYITISIWAAFGAARIVAIMEGGKYGGVASIGILASSIAVAAYNYERVDESDNRIVEAYTRDMLSHIGPNGIIISSQWDYFVSAAYYLQLVENFRPDVTVVDKELMRRSWYYLQLRRRAPWLVDASRRELDAFLVELQKFEHDAPYNPSLIEYRYGGMIRSIIEKNFRSRPVYVTHEIGADYTSGYNLGPAGLAFRVYPDSIRHESPPVDFQVPIPRHRDKYVDGIVSLYAYAFYNNALAAFSEGKKGDAGRYVSEALILEPGMREAAELAKQIR